MGPTTVPPASPGAATPFPAFVVERTADTVTQGVRSFTVDDLGDGDVLVRVDWSSVNFKDGMVVRPGNRVARISPLVPGVDLVGTVVESDQFDPGQPVIVHGYDLGVAHHGGFAAYARVPSHWVVPLPAGLTARQAATIGTAGFTAALSLRRLERHGLTPDAGPVLVTGASGGVGSMAVALLGARGYRVVASTGKDAEHPYLLALGASEVIGREELLVDPGRTLGKARWAGAVDCVGGPTLSAVLRSLDYGAAVAASGLTGGDLVETSVYPFIVRSVALLGIDSVQTPIDERRSVWEELATSYPADRLDDMVDRQVDLDGVSDALSTIAAGGVRGRILVQPTG
jgi:acrylyl-CoA reductase (NADPH)